MQKKNIVYEIYDDYKKDLPSERDMRPIAAMKLMETERAVFVDVRKPSEVDVSSVPGAVTKNQFIKESSKIHNHKIVAYCTIGSRNGKFAMKMAKKGIRVYNLAGGLLVLVLGGGRVINAKGETDILDITPYVSQEIQGSGIESGIVTVFVPGSTGGITSIEYEPGVVQDLKDAVDRVAPKNISSERYSMSEGSSSPLPNVYNRVSLSEYRVIPPTMPPERKVSQIDTISSES